MPGIDERTDDRGQRKGMIESLLPIVGCKCGPVDAEPDSPPFRFGERITGPLRNHPPFLLGESSEDMQLEVGRIRHIGHYEANALFHDPSDEADFTGKAVELGDQHLGRLPLRNRYRFPKLYTSVRLSGLNLNIFSNDFVALANEFQDPCLLRPKAQTRPALLRRRDSIICDIPCHRSPPSNVNLGLLWTGSVGSAGRTTGYDTLLLRTARLSCG